ncbi:adenylate cyclase [Roseibium aquae]|uniref:Adenylate cyclase n=1 Tax=Roseibium aquae TaxID=1323746 RepID=A0A916TN39_9HYPH|nr:DUF3095 domain-containing protein [Roseibium aquae]GGB51639.1 adenylate cyclase [Roseibium aquae]
MTTDFYKNLPVFNDFAGVTDLSAYDPVPDDWVVLAADIVRSRDAIAQGRYREVNLVGAAVIAAVLNRLGRDRIPFVFGGDGALLLIPGQDIDAGRQALSGVAALARSAAGLALRIAAIPMEEIRRRGADIRLRKLELSPGNHLAMAVGGGFELADALLKNPEPDPRFAIEADPEVEPLLDGLSCRWEPIPAREDVVVTLIAKPSSPGELGALVQRICEAVGGDPLSSGASGRFLSEDRLKFRFPPTFLARETAILGGAHGRWKHGLRSALECLAFVWGSLTGRRVGPFEPRRYLGELVRNTDHRRLDDALRLVLDLTTDQADQLRARLEEARLAGKAEYGMHVSDEAMITCFVSDIGDGQHIHFIDGTDGGFARAAEDFDARKKANRGPDLKSA